MNKTIRTAETTQDLKSFLVETKLKSQFELKQVSLSSQSDWLIKDGALAHKTGGFFYVTGFKDETKNIEELVLYQPQSAYTGILLHKSQGKAYLLIEARVEPGNSGIAQYGPTIQSTPANYLRLHGGKKNPYLDYFMNFRPDGTPLCQASLLDLGKRYIQKNKIANYVQTNALLPTTDTMVWTPLTVISQLLSEDHFYNTDLRSILAVFNWDRYIENDRIDNVDFSQALDSSWVLKTNFGGSTGRLISLDQLSKWKVTEDGIQDFADTGSWVNMYQVGCSNREKSEWVQPLYCANSEGKVVLMVREEKGNLEALITMAEEFGISGEIAAHPSFVSYPSENIQAPQITGSQTLLEMRQSEEGGRFYENINHYKVVKAPSDIPIASNQKWVNMPALKALLQTSNKATIQLRGVSSLILDKLNPVTLALS